MFITALFTIAKTWGQPKCPLTDEWIKKMWYLYIMEYYCCYCLVTKLCPTLLCPHGLWPARALCPWDFRGKNTGVGCHFFLQGVFPTQGLNPHVLCLLHC